MRNVLQLVNSVHTCKNVAILVNCCEKTIRTQTSNRFPWLDLRMKRHMDGKGARYTRMHKPVKFVYAEEFSSRSQAMNREREIKKMNHTQKLALTKQFGRR